MILPSAKMRSTREALSTYVPLEACSGKRFALSESTMMIRYEGILDKLHFVSSTQHAIQLRPQTVSSEVAEACGDFVGEVDAEMEQDDCDRDPVPHVEQVGEEFLLCCGYDRLPSGEDWAFVCFQ